MDINTVLNNQENIYYGHGTGTANQEIIDSIIRNGLRCSHGSLYYTSVTLGIGGEIADSEKELLKNWPHKNSEIIIVVSLPIKYNIIDAIGIGTYNMANAAFYYTPDENTRTREELTNSPYVMPQFIAGYYDASGDSFTKNPGYYENLNEMEREKLFQLVKQNYFNIIEDGCGIKEYQQILVDLGHEFPLTNEEIVVLKKNKEIEDLFLKLGSKLLNSQIILPNGNKILVREYIREFVLPFIPAEGFVVLSSESKIPVLHFILECVLYDCQERYNGDFAKYLEENVNIEKTRQVNSAAKLDEHRIR